MADSELPQSSRPAALVVVDMQAGAVMRGPYRRDLVISNIKTLIEACRAKGVDVVYVQHDGSPGEDEERGTEGWEIYAEIRPLPGEKVVRKRFNSAFRQTDLKSHLQARGVETVIVVGMRTEYCIDTTVRVAFELGFSVLLPEWTNTTFDNGELSARQLCELHNKRIFGGRFAELPSMPEALALVADAGRAGHEPEPPPASRPTIRESHAADTMR